jgi:hypothetical protein
MIDLLCKTIEYNIDENTKSSFLIALGYIFQEIKTSDLSNENIIQCIKTLYYIMEKQISDHILLEALKCFQNLISFLKNVFENLVIFIELTTILSYFI